MSEQKKCPALSFLPEDFGLTGDQVAKAKAYADARVAQSVPPADGYLLALETVVPMPDGKNELGYTLLSGVGIFTTRSQVHEAIAELSMPLGWVSMTTSQLLPGWMLPAAPLVKRRAHAGTVAQAEINRLTVAYNALRAELAATVAELVKVPKMRLYGYSMWDPKHEDGEGSAFTVPGQVDPVTDHPDHQGHIWQSRALYTMDQKAPDHQAKALTPERGEGNIVALIAAHQATERSEPWTDAERDRFRAGMAKGDRCHVCSVILGDQHFPTCSKEGT